MGIWSIIALSALALLGLAAIVAGWRGRVVSTDPHCVRCRFNLAGLAQPAVCPACGTNLARRRATRRGLRARRWWLIVAGVVAVLVAAGGFWLSHGGPSVVTLVPPWALI